MHFSLRSISTVIAAIALLGLPYAANAHPLPSELAAQNNELATRTLEPAMTPNATPTAGTASEDTTNHQRKLLQSYLKNPSGETVDDATWKAAVEKLASYDPNGSSEASGGGSQASPKDPKR